VLIDLPLDVRKGPDVDWDPDRDRALQSTARRRTRLRPARRSRCCWAGPLGWEVPACIGAKLGAPETFVLVMLNNTSMGLIRQAEKYGYDEDYAVDLAYEIGTTVGIDHVGVMEAMGALGRRVTEPGDIAATLRWAVDASEEHQLPVLVEIMTERDTDAAMGVAIDAINEYEPVVDGAHERAGAIAGALPERD
jgi:tartronate-semialdehyde synthase